MSLLQLIEGIATLVEFFCGVNLGTGHASNKAYGCSFRSQYFTNGRVNG